MMDLTWIWKEAPKTKESQQGGQASGMFRKEMGGLWPQRVPDSGRATMDEGWGGR